jgi:glycosyltransferase involved in cell wall biosynthesis
VSERPRVLFCLPGLHRVDRGAEVAFESVARELAYAGGFEVTLLGSGPPRADRPYRFLRAPCIPRERFERWPTGPLLRSDCHWEELTFTPGFLRRYDPERYDAVVTCSYPFLNWAVRLRRGRGPGPLHVFVTQNGDWPLWRKNSEFRWFSCDAVVYTNPDYQAAHSTRWPGRLIGNGVDCERFRPGPTERARFGLPANVPLVLMVSALIPEKRVLEGIRAVGSVPGAHLALAGDGPMRHDVDRLAAELLSGRYRRLRLPQSDMPGLYRCADAFLHMSLDEPYGNVYLEALATGLPIVAHERRVSRWILEAQAEYANTTQPAAVAAALARALAQPGPRQDAVELARRRHSWPAVAAQYADFLRERVPA